MGYIRDAVGFCSGARIRISAICVLQNICCVICPAAPIALFVASPNHRRSNGRMLLTLNVANE